MDFNISKEIKQIYNQYNREYFLGKTKRKERAQITGSGQPISDSAIVMMMTNILKLNKFDKVLEIGTGSGYQTLFLSVLAKEVYTIDIIESLSLLAQKRLLTLNRTNISYKIGDGSYGWKTYAPYDKIIVTAGAAEVPKELILQLRKGGLLLIPIGTDFRQSLTLYRKLDNGHITKHQLVDVEFVELKGKYGWNNK